MIVAILPRPWPLCGRFANELTEKRRAALAQLLLARGGRTDVENAIKYRKKGHGSKGRSTKARLSVMGILITASATRVTLPRRSHYTKEYVTREKRKPKISRRLRNAGEPPSRSGGGGPPGIAWIRLRLTPASLLPAPPRAGPPRSQITNRFPSAASSIFRTASADFQTSALPKFL